MVLGLSFLIRIQEMTGREWGVKEVEGWALGLTSSRRGLSSVSQSEEKVASFPWKLEVPSRAESRGERLEK